MIVFRLLLVLACLFASAGSAFAGFPPSLQSCEASKPSGLPATGSPVGGCGGYTSDGNGPFAVVQDSSISCFGGASCGAGGVQATYSWGRKAACPANSSLSNGMCVCAAGFDELNGACVPPTNGGCEAGKVPNPSGGGCNCKPGTTEGPDGMCKPDSLCTELSGKPIGATIQADYGSKSPGSLGRMIGKPTSTCFSGGCTVTGTVEGCWSAQGVAACNITGGTFSGESCDDKAPPGGCPAGSTPSQYAAGVCIPDENKCPAGSSPSKYATGVCIPDENKCPSGQVPSKYAAGVCVPSDDKGADGNGETGDKGKCPPGRVPSKYAAGVCIPADTTVGGGGSGGSGTTCKDGKCTTTKPDGTTDEETEGEFCKKNPDAAQCKKGSWGGQCGSWTCEGDAIQCAIAQEQHKTNCKLFDEKTSHPLTQAALDGTDEQSAEKLKSKAAQVSVQQLDANGLGWGRACPADIAFEVAGKSFSISYSKVCPILGVMANAAVGLTLLSCLLWVVGKKE